VRAGVDARGAAGVGVGAAEPGRVPAEAVSGPAGQQPGRARPGDRPGGRVLAADRPGRRRRVQRPRAVEPGAGLDPAEDGGPGVRRGQVRAAAGDAAPEPAGVRQADGPVDAGAGGRRGPRAGADRPGGERRDGPAGDPAAGRGVEAGQALDHQSRPAVRPKKSQRDRL
ncbi:MAG: hypothetical protein AVDCRST_MAG64-3685, partial [uncultured Phycisphaerae bacterium]